MKISDHKMRGMLSPEQLEKMVGQDLIRTVVVAFTDHYGRLVGKRFDAEHFIDDVLGHGTHACDYLLATDMDMDTVPGYRFANWNTGYADVHLAPDLGTLRLASWLDKTAIIFCDVKDSKGSDIPVAPRSLLRRQLERANDAGFATAAASELEYYLFRNSYRDAESKGCVNLEEAGWYAEDYHVLQGTRNENFTAAVRQHLKNSGVPVESSKGETGIGQHEVNVRHAETLEMADRHIIFKQCLKEVADQLGMSVTFMAKVAADRAGSSSHIHFSLWKGKKNVFAGNEQLGPIRCSKIFQHFLGGWMRFLPEVMVFYAPTVNSYKRYAEGSWAPTRIAWSYDNRTAGFRVVGKDQSLRIECRIPGADCNPYLAFAAALASGLAGVEEKIAPPARFEGDLYAAAHIDRVPQNACGIH